MTTHKATVWNESPPDKVNNQSDRKAQQWRQALKLKVRVFYAKTNSCPNDPSFFGARGETKCFPVLSLVPSSRIQIKLLICSISFTASFLLLSLAWLPFFLLFFYTLHHHHGVSFNLHSMKCKWCVRSPVCRCAGVRVLCFRLISLFPCCARPYVDDG